MTHQFGALSATDVQKTLDSACWHSRRSHSSPSPVYNSALHKPRHDSSTVPPVHLLCTIQLYTNLVTTAAQQHSTASPSPLYNSAVLKPRHDSSTVPPVHLLCTIQLYTNLVTTAAQYRQSICSVQFSCTQTSSRQQHSSPSHITSHISHFSFSKHLFLAFFHSFFLINCLSFAALCCSCELPLGSATAN